MCRSCLNSVCIIDKNHLQCGQGGVSDDDDDDDEKPMLQNCGECDRAFSSLKLHTETRDTELLCVWRAFSFFPASLSVLIFSL